MTFVEFMEKSRQEGFRGLPVIDGRSLRSGTYQNITLSWHGTNNGLWEEGEFGYHGVGPIEIRRSPLEGANAKGFGYKYLIKDVQNGQH